MKKEFALFMMTVGCIVSISACGVSKAPEKSSSSDTVREISIDNGKEAAQETEATEKPTAAAPKSYARIRSKAKIESYGGTVKAVQLCGQLRQELRIGGQCGGKRPERQSRCL